MGLNNESGTHEGAVLVGKVYQEKQFDRHPVVPVAGKGLSMCFATWICMRAQNPTTLSYDSKEILLPGCCSVLCLILLLCGTALT